MTRRAKREERKKERKSESRAEQRVKRVGACNAGDSPVVNSKVGVRRTGVQVGHTHKAILLQQRRRVSAQQSFSDNARVLPHHVIFVCQILIICDAPRTV